MILESLEPLLPKGWQLRRTTEGKETIPKSNHRDIIESVRVS